MNPNAEKSISVVIPCYRSAEVLPDLVAEVTVNLSKLTSKYEVILVVDGSPDVTWDVALSIASDQVRAIRLSRNFGQQNAALAGIRAARNEIIVTMDDDFQHRPNDIQTLVQKLEEGFDLVFGYPKKRSQGFVRNRLTIMTKSFVARAAGVPKIRDMSSFRVFRSALRQGLEGVAGPQVSINVALAWTTTNIGLVEVNNDPRRVGSSNYTNRDLVRQAMNLMIGYSAFPLRIVAYGGFVFALFGLGLFIFEIWSNLTGRTTVPGFTTTVALTSVFSGAQLIGIGVVGEYLARIYMYSIGKPSYVISESTG